MIRIFYVPVPATAPRPNASPDLVVRSIADLATAARTGTAPDGRPLRPDEVDLVRALADRLDRDDADVVATPPALYRVLAR